MDSKKTLYLLKGGWVMKKFWKKVQLGTAIFIRLQRYADDVLSWTTVLQNNIRNDEPLTLDVHTQVKVLDFAYPIIRAAQWITSKGIPIQ